MKLRKFLILGLIISIAALIIWYFSASSDEINLIILDPGHGADDVGCSYDGINEKDINYDIALRLEKLLKELDYKVVFTHDDSEYVSPYDRAKFANRKGGDLYISIHQNAADNTDATGIETWYSIRNPRSLLLAEMIQNRLIAETGAEDRGAKFTNGLIVVRETKMPSVLIECGFLSNEYERNMLNDENYRQKIAQSIAQAVDDFALH